MNEVENRMVMDSEWPESPKEPLPECECCREEIRQPTALHILSGKRRVWICDRCIEDLKEPTGY